MTLLLILAWGGLFVYWMIVRTRQNKDLNKLIQMEAEFEGVKGARAVIDAQQFEKDFKARLRQQYKAAVKVFQPNMPLKLLLFFSISAGAVYAINEFFFRQDFMTCLIIVEPILFVMFFAKLKQRQAEKFKNNFPDALNILSGA
ncbi:MAG: pilus assembly protein TadB, partial [Vibrio tubiashii]